MRTRVAAHWCALDVAGNRHLVHPRSSCHDRERVKERNTSHVYAAMVEGFACKSKSRPSMRRNRGVLRDHMGFRQVELGNVHCCCAVHPEGRRVAVPLDAIETTRCKNYLRPVSRINRGARSQRSHPTLDFRERAGKAVLNTNKSETAAVFFLNRQDHRHRELGSHKHTHSKSSTPRPPRCVAHDLGNASLAAC